MNKPVHRCSRPLIAAALAAIVLAGNGIAPAQEDDFSEMQLPDSAGPATNDFTFKMKLDPGVVVSIALREMSKKSDDGQDDNASEAPKVAQVLTIQRDIRSGIIGIRTEYSDKRPPSEMYYAGGWCAYDDPRKGLNVRRPNIEGLIFPMQNFHFPELMWAVPSTRKPDPKVREGKPAIHRYKEGGRTLEVDATTLLPLRYLDGQNEWKYSFAPSGKAFVVPDNIKTALLRVLKKAKSK